jgi:hypothetical protein
LSHLLDLAEQAKDHDPKLREVAAQIEEIRRSEPNANVLVYTEYVTSQHAAKDALKRLGEVLTMSGEDDDETRSKVIGAEPDNIEQANAARNLGGRVSSVNLAAFVRDAVLLEQGDIEGSISDPIFTLVIPPSWDHGLDEYPGFSPDSRRFRLTTNMDVVRDSADQSVGFLGRAHPLVRMALARVRHLSLGTGIQHQDLRVSAVAGRVKVTTDIYMQAVGPQKREAQSNLVRLVRKGFDSEAKSS